MECSNIYSSGDLEFPDALLLARYLGHGVLSIVLLTGLHQHGGF